MLSTVDEASIVEEVALSLVDTSVVDDDASGVVESVEEESVDDELWDT